MKVRTGFDFDEKYNLYHKMVYKICVTYLGNKQDAEDAFQEVFVKLAYKAPNFVYQEDEKAWLIRITINHCKNILKSAWKKRVIPTDDLFSSTKNTIQTDRLVFNEIFHLELKQKEVIYLYYIEGYKIKEISKILNVSESCVKMRMSRAKNSLKHILEDEDGQ